MDQDKIKSVSTSNSSKNSVKYQSRHQEHNYTNPSIDTSTPSKGRPGEMPVETDPLSTDSTDNQSPKNSTFGVEISSQNKVDTNPRQILQPTSTSPIEKQPTEAKKVIRKDIYNRIRRSEEELRKAAEMVRGGMTFQTASDTFHIPISTIRFYMARRGILPQRRRGRGSVGMRDDDLIHPPFEIIHYRLPDIDKPL